jgi:hypothetical protein
MLVDFVLENGRIIEIGMMADPERIATRDIQF